LHTKVIWKFHLQKNCKRSRYSNGGVNFVGITKLSYGWMKINYGIIHFMSHIQLKDTDPQRNDFVQDLTLPVMQLLGHHGHPDSVITTIGQVHIEC